MPGNSKAYNFLIKRKAAMKPLGIEDKETNQFPLDNLVFKSEYVICTLEMIEEMFRKNLSEKEYSYLKDFDTSGFKIEPILTETLFKKLRKPL